MVNETRPEQCAFCAKSFVRQPMGRPRRFCSPACRQAAYRLRTSADLVAARAETWGRLGRPKVAEGLRREASLIVSGEYAAARAEGLDLLAHDWEALGDRKTAAELRAEAEHLRGGGH